MKYNYIYSAEYTIENGIKGVVTEGSLFGTYCSNELPKARSVNEHIICDVGSTHKLSGTEKIFVKLLLFSKLD